MNKIIVILVCYLATSECGILFEYTMEDPHDPKNVANLKQALTQTGTSVDGIDLKSFSQKMGVLNTKYKANYVNKLGQGCHFHWKVNNFIGLFYTPTTPVCENVAIGAGNVAPSYVYPAPVVYPSRVYYPTTGVPVACPRCSGRSIGKKWNLHNG